jgi:prolipoprotein diacylglyceryl transferase
MIWNIDPVLLELGPLELRYYGVFFAGSLMAAYFLARRFARQRKLSIEHLDNLIVYLIVGLVLGARFGHILFYELDFYLQNPELILQVWRGGLASHGAAIGVLLAYLLFLWRNKGTRFWDYADIISIVAAFPIIFVRLGNFFNSEIVGRPWDGPWSVTFPRVDDIARHPTVLYESLIGVILLAVLWPLWEKKQKGAKAGFFTGLFFILYFGLRFFSEFTKDLAIQEGLAGLTTGQLLSIPFVLAGIWILSRKKA